MDFDLNNLENLSSEEQTDKLIDSILRPVAKTQKTENDLKLEKRQIFWVNVLYFVIISLLIGLQILFNKGIIYFESDLYNNFAFGLISQIFIFGIVTLVGFCLIKKQGIKQTFKDFRIKKISFKAVLISILLGVCVYFLNGYIASLFQGIIRILGYETTPSSSNIPITIEAFLLYAFYSAVLPGFFEEFTHRGMLLSTYKKRGVASALVMSSLLFGLMHLNINQCFYAIIVGYILGMVTIFSGSVIPAMIIHFINNFFGVYADFALSGGWPIYSVDMIFNYVELNFGTIAMFIVAFIFILLLCYLLIWGIKKLYNDKLNANVDAKLKQIVLANYYAQKFAIGAELVPLQDSQLDLIVNSIKIIINNRLAQRLAKGEKVVTLEMLNDENVELNKFTLLEKIFLYGTIVLAGLCTIFSFVWGVL